MAKRPKISGTGGFKLGPRTLALGAVGAFGLFALSTCFNDGENTPEPSAPAVNTDTGAAQYALMFHQIANPTQVSYEVAPDEPGPTVQGCAISDANAVRQGNRTLLQFQIPRTDRSDERVYSAWVPNSAFTTAPRANTTQGCTAVETAPAPAR